MRGPVSPITPVPKTDFPADATAAVITLAATAGVRHVVDKVFGGYDDYPDLLTTLTITLTVAATAVTLTYPVTVPASVQSDPPPNFDLNFDPPLQGDENKEIVITLLSGAGAIAGKLNAITR